MTSNYASDFISHRSILIFIYLRTKYTIIIRVRVMKKNQTKTIMEDSREAQVHKITARTRSYLFIVVLRDKQSSLCVCGSWYFFDSLSFLTFRTREWRGKSFGGARYAAQLIDPMLPRILFNFPFFSFFSPFLQRIIWDIFFHFTLFSFLILKRDSACLKYLNRSVLCFKVICRMEH